MAQHPNIFRRFKYRTLRKILRYIPRPHNIRRFPVLSRFAHVIKARPYLWSYHRSKVVPAIILGSILAFLPIVGVQLIVALALAIIIKANLPILAALQFISNPITLVPIYFANYQVGTFTLKTLGITAQTGDGPWGALLSMNATMLGGLILGLAFGLTLYGIYHARSTMRLSKISFSPRRVG